MYNLNQIMYYDLSKTNYATTQCYVQFVKRKRLFPFPLHCGVATGHIDRVVVVQNLLKKKNIKYFIKLI